VVRALLLAATPLLLAGCGRGTVIIKGTLDSDSAAGDTSTPEGETAEGEGEGDSESGGGDDSSAESGETGEPDPGVEIIPDILVSCDGSEAFSHIQDAIDASVSGDIIGVEACTYHERLHYNGHSVVVYGIDGSAATILDADEGGTALNVENGEGLGTRFAGFTITGGYDPYDGSAIEVSSANLELEDVVITGNAEGHYIIDNLGGWLDLTDVTVTDNVVGSDGYAISADGGAMTVEGLTLDCGGGAAGIRMHLSLNIDRSTITCDTGYGIDNYHGEIWMQRSFVTGGVAGVYTYDSESTPEEPDDPEEHMYIYNSAIGGGSVGVDVLYEDARIVNSVLWGGDAALRMTACNTESYAINSVFLDSACGISGDQSFNESYNAFYGNTEDGCGVLVDPTVSEDPGFSDFPGDLSLLPDSPLIDAGNPNAAYDDPDGTRNDLGRYGGPWGGS
jgi:hypothetical protein